MSTSKWYEAKKMADYEAEWQAAKRALPVFRSPEAVLEAHGDNLWLSYREQYPDLDHGFALIPGDGYLLRNYDEDRICRDFSGYVEARVSTIHRPGKFYVVIWDGDDRAMHKEFPSLEAAKAGLEELVQLMPFRQNELLAFGYTFD